MDHYFDSFIEDDEQQNQVNNDEEEDTEQDRELSEDDIEFLLANTGFNLEQIQRWYLEFKLKCTQGLIEYDQFKIYYKSMLPDYLDHYRKEQLIRNLFKLFDIDADGFLNFTEFLVSFWIRFKAPVNEKFTWLFNMFDLDRNGYLNQAEMTNAMSLCMNVDDLDRLLDALKSDYSKVLTAPKGSYNSKPKQPPALYQQFDKDSLIDTEDCDEVSDDSCDSFDENSDEEDLFANRKLDERYFGAESIQSVEEKLNECLILMSLISRKEIRMNENDNDSTNEWMFFERRRTVEESSQFFYKNSNGYFNYLSTNMGFQMKRVQFTRESFLFLCEKYKLLRKLLLPIKCFYDNSNNKQ
jgi:Ca2+-binding EF-hand superfamily protein